jgi:hypothetical protein
LTGSTRRLLQIVWLKGHRERADAAGTIAAEYLDVVVFCEMECAGF